MPFTNPTDAQLASLLTSATTIAMVGASGNPERPSYGIMRKLQSVGYRVIPVNPRETESARREGVRVARRHPEPVDIVDVFRRAEDTPAIADEAVAIGAKALWLQTGIASDEAAARAAGGRPDGRDGRVHRRHAASARRQQALIAERSR